MYIYIYINYFQISLCYYTTPIILTFFLPADLDLQVSDENFDIKWFEYEAQNDQVVKKVEVNMGLGYKHF